MYRGLSYLNLASGRGEKSPVICSDVIALMLGGRINMHVQGMLDVISGQIKPYFDIVDIQAGFCGIYHLNRLRALV